MVRPDCANQSAELRVRMLAACGWLGMAAAAAYVFVLPYGHLTAVRSLAFVVALLSAAVVWVLMPQRVPLTSLFAIWLLVALSSLAASADVSTSLEAIERDIVRSFLVFVVFYLLSVTFRFNDLAVAATAGGMGLLSILAVRGVLTSGEWTSYYVPLLGEFTTSALTVLPLLVGYLFTPAHDRRVVLLVLIALPLILVAGHLTLSRAFWVVMACAAAAAVVLYVLRMQRFHWRALVALAVITAVGTTLAAVAAFEKDRSPVKFDDREAIYAVAIRKIQRNPLTGAGYGHETDKGWYAEALPRLNVFHPHNILLSFVDQMGPAGIVALITVFGLPALALRRRWRHREAAIAVPCISALVLLVTVFVRNNVDYFFLKHNLWLFFAHLGVCLGEVRRLEAHGDAREKAS